MKKLVFALALVLGAFSLQAQQLKIGYIATDELISQLPEAEKADADLKAFQNELSDKGQEMMKELSEKDSLFVKDSAKMSPTMKDIRRGELMELYQKVQSWNQQAQELVQQKSQEIVAPLRNRVLEAIKSVASKNKYDYILDQNAVIVGPPGNDVLDLVKKELGIKDKPAQAPVRKN
jgi:outer membrane protein